MKYKQILESLTQLEILAVLSAFESSNGNGHDFGFTDDIEITGVSKKAVGGVISSLIKKGVIVYDDEYNQFAFLEFGDSDEKTDAINTIKILLLGYSTALDESQTDNS